MKVLVVEDNPERIKFFKQHSEMYNSMFIAENAEDAIAFLESDNYDFIFLDHDLGGEENVDTTEYNTGTTVVKYMVDNNCSEDANIIVHSLNEPAAISMTETLVENGYDAKRVSFLKLKEMA